MNEIKQTLQQDADVLLKRLQQSRKNGTGVTLGVSDVGVLCEEIEQLKHDKEYSEESCTGWIDKAYKQRAKNELIKNQVEKFKSNGSIKELPRFLDYLIDTAKFKHDEEFKDHILLPIELSDEIAEKICEVARCCGGGALDIYETIIEAAKEPSHD